MMDINNANVEVRVRDDGKVIWANVDGVCLMRCSDCKTIVVTDERPKPAKGWKPYVNKKNGNTYYVVRDGIPDETNSHDAHESVVVYTDSSGNWFVREREEFMQKFEGKT